MRPEDQLHGQGGNRESRISLLYFPEEVMNAIVEEIAIHDMATLALTNKAVRAYIQPHLYHKVYTRLATPQDTAGLVKLVRRRPDVVPHINTLVLDEYHPHHTRELLGIMFPNLWCLLIQDESGVSQEVSEREKRALDQGLAQQPKLSNCESSGETATRRLAFLLSALLMPPQSSSTSDSTLVQQRSSRIVERRRLFVQAAEYYTLPPVVRPIFCVGEFERTLFHAQELGNTRDRGTFLRYSAHAANVPCAHRGYPQQVDCCFSGCEISGVCRQLCRVSQV